MRRQRPSYGILTKKPETSREHSTIAARGGFIGWCARASRPVEMPEAMVERGAKAVCESHCADGITWEELCLDPDMEEYVEQERRNAETCLTAALSALAVKGE